MDGLFMPDIALVFGGLVAVIAGVVIICANEDFFVRFLGALLIVLAVCGWGWLWYASGAPWQFAGEVTVTCAEVENAQVIVYPSAYGSNHYTTTNVNVFFARKFPDKAKFKIRYYDKNAVYRGVKFVTDSQNKPDYIISVADAEEDNGR